MPLIRPRSTAGIALITTLLLLYLWTSSTSSPTTLSPPPPALWRTPQYESYFWTTLPLNYPPKQIRPLPTTSPLKFPKIQAPPPSESPEALKTRLQRQAAVKDVFSKCWASYKRHAWKADELAPVSGGKKNPFGGWAATLVDSLDTLYLMDMKPEFDDAVAAAASIDFTKTDLEEVNVFETTIRYLGGFLSAYDLSADARLLSKAVEVGEMLYRAFDTPNRMPITRWAIHAAMASKKQVAPAGLLVAEIGSLSMEFTRLSMLTRDPKWFDAVQRITEGMAAQQNSTALPGLWPLVVSAQDEVYNVGDTFTLGAMADSVYEYLPKMTALTGGQLPVYREMYEAAMATALKHNLFRPMTPTDEDILIAGTVKADDNGATSLEPQGQHLVCFLGGLLTLGGKLFGRNQDLDAARRLVDGCVWTYKALPRGIMPETFTMLPCPSSTCAWDEASWKRGVLARSKDAADKKAASDADAVISRDRLPKGFTSIPDRRYILRPEAIESVFVSYRATANPALAESAWDMFAAINATTSTRLANSAVWDVTRPMGEDAGMADSMESFWMGETLKYFYLVFAAWDEVSLDEWVFNTEAHPFRRLLP
ncbi:seven-hairpin glycosidase [Trichoderma gracile]